VIVYEDQNKQFTVTWKSDKNKIGYFKSGTTNLKDYTAAVETDKPSLKEKYVKFQGENLPGRCIRSIGK